MISGSKAFEPTILTVQTMYLLTMTPLAQRERMYEPKTQVTVEPQADGDSMNDEPGEATPVDDLPF